MIESVFTEVLDKIRMPCVINHSNQIENTIIAGTNETVILITGVVKHKMLTSEIVMMTPTARKHAIT